MHKIDKFLARLNTETREKILVLIERIQQKDFVGLDIRMLKGSSDTYRVRMGNIRIKFFMNASSVRIFSIERRGEKTYRDI